MEEENFQKIELFETNALSKDKEKVDIRKNAIEAYILKKCIKNILNKKGDE